MDPLINLFIRRNSFTTPKSYLQDFPLVGYIADVNPNDIKLDISNETVSILVDETLYHTFNELSYIYDEEKYREASAFVDPFFHADILWLKTFIAKKLATIDATTSFIGSSFPHSGNGGVNDTSINEGSINAYNGGYSTKGIYITDTGIASNDIGFKEINKNYAGNLTQVISGELKFICVNDINGGYAEYLQKRLPESTGTIICKGDTRITPGTLDPHRTKIIISDDMENNGFTIQDSKVNIITINYTGNRGQVWELIHDIITAIRSLEIGGSIIIDSFEIHQQTFADVIFILSLMFKNITMFKTIGDLMENRTCTIVLRTFNGIGIMEDILTEIYDIDPDTDVTRLLSERSKQFDDFWISSNNIVYQTIIDRLLDIQEQLKIYPEQFNSKLSSTLDTSNFASIIQMLNKM